MASLNSKVEDIKPDFKDQGLTHHILMYKTRTVFVSKRGFKIDVIASRVEDLLGSKEFEPALFNA